METVNVTVRNDGWVSGKLQNVTFYALVFDECSENGINGGRISKLFIYQQNSSPSKLVARYERGWEKPLTEDIKPAYERIRQTLESLPVEETV